MMFELTPEQDAELDRYYRDEARHNYWMAVWGALSQSAKFHDNYSLNWWGRMFYSAKAVVCLLLRRRGSPTYKDNIVGVIALWDIVSMAGYDNPPWAESWMQLDVGHGIFGNWWYDIMWDANC